jgi:hypothetical protein
MNHFQIQKPLLLHPIKLNKDSPMSKIINNGDLLSPRAFKFSPSRRWLLKMLGLTPAARVSKASDLQFCDNPDDLLQDLEQKILSAHAIVDQLIIRQGLAEHALWQVPGDLRWRMALDVIDRDLAKAHERLTQLIARLNESPATTLPGLQVKARLMAYDDEIAQSLRHNILALPNWPG